MLTEQKSLSIVKLLLPFCFLFVVAVFSTNTSYHFGDVNHIEQLPHIFSKNNGNYLSNDFFVQYTREINPRYYYSLFLAEISKIAPLEAAFYILTITSNFLILVITYFAAKPFVSSGFLAVLPALGLVSVTRGNLGGAGFITSDYLTPQLIAMPWVLLAYLLSTNGKFLIASCCLLISLAVQPSLALLVAIPIIGNLMLTPGYKYKLQKAAILFISLVVCTFILFPNNTGGVLESGKLIHILAYFRHPHHYIPSRFPFQDYRDFAILTFLSISSLVFLYQHPPSNDGGFEARNFKAQRKTAVNYYISTWILSLALMLAGYIFVELVPIKQIVELQTFRLVFLLRWIEIVTITVAVVVMVKRLFDTRVVNIMLILAVMYFMITRFSGDTRILSPNLSMVVAEDRKSLYTYIFSNTTADTIFLTPPDFGDMRVIPKRGVVVDFKSFPFNEDAMNVWYKRITDCYGEGDLSNNYSIISDSKLWELKGRYRFEYVVVYANTKSVFEPVYEDDKYKMLKI